MKCRYCEKTTNLYPSKNGKRIRYICRDCNTKRFREYRRTSNGKEAINRAIKKYEANHPERRNAWNKAQKIKLEYCIICGEKAHRHHPDPLKPFEVIFLCPLHHKKYHLAL